MTSIAGLACSTLLEGLRVVWPLKYSKSDDPVHQSLINIEQGLEAFANKTLENQKALLDEIGHFKNENSELNNRLINTVQSSQEMVVKEIHVSRETSNKNFENQNTLLKESLESISASASEEIIKALEQVITNFNENLKEQFGENFKQLNEACFKLVEWQEKYRESMIQNEKTLNSARVSIEQSVKAVDNAEKILNQASQQIEQINEMGRTWEAALEQIRKTTVTINNQLESEEKLLGSIDSVLESAQKNSSKVLENLSDSQHKLDALVKNTQGAFSAQAEQLRGVTEECGNLSRATQQELAKALENLENALTSLTNQFSSNYREFLEKIKELMVNESE